VNKRIVTRRIRGGGGPTEKKGTEKVKRGGSKKGRGRRTPKQKRKKKEKEFWWGGGCRGGAGCSLFTTGHSDRGEAFRQLDKERGRAGKRRKRGRLKEDKGKMINVKHRFGKRKILV